jgi:hypothetical protein
LIEEKKVDPLLRRANLSLKIDLFRTQIRLNRHVHNVIFYNE